MNKLKNNNFKKLLSEPLILLTIIFILLFLIIFIIYPLVSILKTSVIKTTSDSSIFTLEAYVKAITDRSFLASLKILLFWELLSDCYL